MAGRSGRLTQTQRMFVSWQSGLGKYEVQIKQLNRSRYVSIADMYPDDAEMLALMILEAVKKARDDGK